MREHSRSIHTQSTSKDTCIIWLKCLYFGRRYFWSRWSRYRLAGSTTRKKNTERKNEYFFKHGKKKKIQIILSYPISKKNASFRLCFFPIFHILILDLISKRYFYGKYRSSTEQIYAQSSSCASCFCWHRKTPHTCNHRIEFYDD